MLLNWELLSHPVNYIKVGLMAATFLLGALVIAQLFMSAPGVTGIIDKSPTTPQPGQTG